jgi:hypothetical protein
MFNLRKSFSSRQKLRAKSRTTSIELQGLSMKLCSNFVKQQDRDHSYLVKYNGFCASFRLSSKGTSFNETFSIISAKRSSVVSFCKLGRSSLSSRDLLDFLTREPIATHFWSQLPNYTICLCKTLKLVFVTIQHYTPTMD